MSFYQDYSPTLNGTVPFNTTTTFTPYFVSSANVFLDPIVIKFNNNGASILESCVLDSTCQKAGNDEKGCAAVCGKLGDTHVVTFRSKLDASSEDRWLNIDIYDLFAANKSVSASLSKSNKNDAFAVYHDGSNAAFKSTLKEDTNNAEKQGLENAVKQLETILTNVKPGATPQEGWSIGTGLALAGSAAVGGALVYGAQKMQEKKEQQNTIDAKSNRVPLSKFSKV